MVKSLFRRFLYALALLGIISIIAFWLSKQVPGDVVMDYISIDDRGYNASFNPVQHRLAYERVAAQRGLNLPEFYLSITPEYIPESIHRILPFEDRKVVKKWIYHSKNGDESLALYHVLRTGLFSYCNRTNLNSVYGLLCHFCNHSLNTPEIRIIHANALALGDSLRNNTTFASDSINILKSVVHSCEILMNPAPFVKGPNWFPDINWYGPKNQYHQWMKGLLFQQPLTSLVDGRNAWTKIYDALKWTLLLNGFALILSILLGTGIGIWSGTRDGDPGEKIVNWILFALFALPSFWLGTLFIYFFASGEWLSIFPAGGLGPYHAAGNIFERWAILFSHLFLPVICLALGALAYISRQMKHSIRHELNKPYVASLRTQGISEKTIIRGHVIRNALFPIITIVGGSIPVLLSGSLIIEVIFSIPGMGRLMYNSLLSRDWPVVFPVLMLGAAITIFSYIVTDIIYKWVDPRVKIVRQ